MSRVLFIIIVVAYLLGSIPFGYLIVRATSGADVRELGSGGTGATNVSRRAGKAAGVLTLILDALKGIAAVVFAGWIFGKISLGGNIGSANSAWWVTAAAIAVIVGHMFPVWLKFRGGKGVATGVGVFIVLAPLALLISAALFLLTVWRTRYVSLGSIVAAAAIALIVLIQGLINPAPNFAPLLTAAVLGALLIIFAHRANIRRLIKGSESKFQ